MWVSELSDFNLCCLSLKMAVRRDTESQRGLQQHILQLSATCTLVFTAKKGRSTGLKEIGWKCSWTQNKIVRFILSIKTHMHIWGLGVRKRKILSMGVKERKTVSALTVSIWCPLLHPSVFLKFFRMRRRASVCRPFLHSSTLL